MKVLRTLTNCIEKCDLDQEVKIKSIVDNKPVWTPFTVRAKSYRKKDFKDIDFDKTCVKYVKEKSLSLTRTQFPELSLVLYKEGISKEENKLLLQKKIMELGNLLANLEKDPDITIVNLKTFNLLSGVEYSKEEIGLEDTIVATNLTITGMNVYVMEDRLIGNNVIVFSTTKKGRTGIYSIINNRRRFFNIDCVGEFNQGVAFKYIY
jgi:hypothetical protein